MIYSSAVCIALENTPPQVLNSTAWKECVDAVLLKKSDWLKHTDIVRRHSHTLRRLFEDDHLRIDAVLCVDRRPTLCVLNAKACSNSDVEQIRRRLWNLGATTLLLVETQTEVCLYSTLSKPSRSDDIGKEAKLSEETIANLEAAALALHLQRLIRRIETGAIYRDYKSRFNAKEAVDRELLENLKNARNVISPKKTPAELAMVHKLIGRFLFSCYLLDRGIIGPPYLASKQLPEATDMLQMLSGALFPAKTLEQLFTALHRDFNGSLFGEPFPHGSISELEVNILRRLLAGENLKTGQLALGFKLYNFSYIPVELISSIYEEFLGAEAAAAIASTHLDESRRNAQRAKGAYYTPPRLAELAVDIATEGWDTLLDKRCLDPACGSGIFLVILFVRMSEEWRKRNPNATTKERYEGLLSLLEKNLHGIDIELTACLVTCFSLYLAFLDQMEPKEISELRLELERAANAKILPRILWQKSDLQKPRVRDRHFPTIREFDFFSTEVIQEFDLVVGNPPWISRKPAPNAASWLYSEKNPHAIGLGWKSERKDQSQDAASALFPAQELACAFMWKASLHLQREGRVCQILPSRVFLSNNTNSFQSSWLERHELESVWLLADYRFILFPTADCPCFIARYRSLAKDKEVANFEFVTPKVERLDPRSAALPVLPEDQKKLSQKSLIFAAKNNEAASFWKQNYWGTPRDSRLVERLLKWPRLSRIAVSPPDEEGEEESVQVQKEENMPLRTWYAGQGFQPATESTKSPDKIFWRSTARYLSARANVSDFLLLHNQTEQIGSLYKDTGLHRKRNPLLYRAPMLLINKACTKFLYSDFDVLFQDDFQSICVPLKDKTELLFLTAYFASPLAQYLLFHTTANIGIERDIARLTEMLELPFPLPEDMTNSKKARGIINDCASCILRLQKDLSDDRNLLRRDTLIAQARKKLNQKVYAYFELCDWEEKLVDDTVNIFRPSSTPASLDAEKLYTAKTSNSQERENYATILTETFRAWSKTKLSFWTEICISSKTGLALVTLGISKKQKPHQESETEKRIEDLLVSIRELSKQSDGVVFYKLRGFAYYEKKCVHLLKPLTLRHWTSTAALNDADEIIMRMMEEGGWGV